jgi:hypothetical protein
VKRTYNEKAGAYWNGPAMDGVYARRGRAWKALPHVGSGGTTQSFTAERNPIATAADGLAWDCYLGQAAVDQGILDASLLGQYQPTPSHG